MMKSENDKEKSFPVQPSVITKVTEQERPVWYHVIAGVTAGCMTSFVTCPLDVVKTRMQTTFIPKKNGNGSAISTNPMFTPNYVISGKTWSSLVLIWRREGLRGLYRGLTPTLIGYLPTFGLYFPIYHTLKRRLSEWLGLSWLDPRVHLASAIGAGACSSFTTNPLWLVRTRLMTQGPGSAFRYSSIGHALKEIVKREGVKGLYKGLTPAALGLFHVAVQFPLYERFKQLLQQKVVDNDHHHHVALSAPRILLASTCSKVIATTITYPHEVLRTRFQFQIGFDGKYRNIVQAAKLIFHEEGIAGFYRGLGTTLMRVIPATAVTFVTFEKMLQIIPSFFEA